MDCIIHCVFYWYTGRDSNPQPSEPESDALSIEPPVHLPSYYSRLFPVCKGVNFKKISRVLGKWLYLRKNCDKLIFSEQLVARNELPAGMNCVNA